MTKQLTNRGGYLSQNSPYRKEFIILKKIFCDKCQDEIGTIGIAINFQAMQQFVFFKCDGCNQKEYLHILDLDTKITPELLKEILVDQFDLYQHRQNNKEFWKSISEDPMWN